MERTLILLKPDALQRGLAGAIISRLERRGLKLVGMKLMQLDDALARRHYAEHEGKPFVDSLIEFITSGPLIAAAVEGPNDLGSSVWPRSFLQGRSSRATWRRRR